MTRLRLFRIPAFVLLVGLTASFGCGGGGVKGNLTGVVTDVDGRAVAGATVSVGSTRTSSLSNGTFTLGGIGSGFKTVKAEIIINGRKWSGETVVDLVGNEQNRSVNIVVSDERFHGRIEGTVIDSFGVGLPGTKVFVGGPLSSTLAITRSDGTYTVPKLTPGVTYTVTASRPGYQNETRTVTVLANSTAGLSFSLTPISPIGTLPAPQNVSTQSWTVAASITRADEGTKSLYEWVKRLYRKKKGLPNGPQARTIEYKSGRATPPGAVIEVDLFWDYEAFEDLFGYLIRRGTSSNPNSLADTALLRDPLTRVFFDVDPILTPDTTYYYTVHRLDTVLFPNRGTVGPASSVVRAQPLAPTTATRPFQGEQVVGNPIFAWSPVLRADTYQIFVWDRFPDLQNPSDPNGVSPIWPVDLDNPGSSLVSAPRTTQAYEGPPLQKGRTYYWFVVASDAEGENLSVTQVAKFTPK